MYRQIIPIVISVLFICAISKVHAQVVDINPDSTHQTIRGFGAAFIEFWQPDLTANQVETAFGSADGQLGLSILRLGINPDSTRWSENLVAAKKAHEMGAIIFASPWNAPRNLLKEKINSGDGDTIDVDKYDEYAQFLDDFNSYMNRNRVDIYAISVQNEPDFAHDWTGWTAENMVKFLRESAPIIGTRVMAPESFQFIKSFSDPILQDSLATAHVDIIGGHIYGGGNSSYPLAEEKGKEVWMTEYLLNLNTGNTTKTWDEFTDEERWEETMEMAAGVHKSMESNMQAYIWWYLKRYYSFLGDGQFREGEGVVTKRGYTFSHFSKYVRPGFVRIDSQGPFGRGYQLVDVSVYSDTLTGEVVIIALNNDTGNKSVEFVIKGMNSAVFTPIRSTVNETLEHLEDVNVAGNLFSDSLPGQSITTYVSSGISVGNETVTNLPSSIQLNQNYPNPFNPNTVISYQLPESSVVSVKVFDMLGREVATLVDGRMSAGTHQVLFDASNLASGVYIYQLVANGYSDVKRMLLVK